MMSDGAGELVLAVVLTGLKSIKLQLNRVTLTPISLSESVLFVEAFNFSFDDYCMQARQNVFQNPTHD